VSIWAVIVAGGVVTFVTRLSFIAAEGRVAVPAWFRAMLPFVPVATLTALYAPDLLRPGGAWHVSLANPRLVAGAAAIAVAAISRSVFLTLVVGFGTFLLLILAT
jgi:branched-subunit amino acid transport protein